MRVRGIDHACHAGRLIAEVASWTHVQAVRPSCGVGVGLAAGTREVVHLHRDDEAELCLTRQVVARLQGALIDSGRQGMDPVGDWVRMPLDGIADVSLAIALVSVAIKAADADPQPAPTARITACSVEMHHSR